MRRVSISLLYCMIGLAAAPAAHAVSPFLPTSPFHDFASVIEIQADPAQPEKHNYIKILNEGDAALKLRIHLIRNAHESIDIQTFIWTNDESGMLVMKELIDAANRGVNVRVLIDHIASDKNPEELAYISMSAPNMKIKYYRPVAKRLRSPLPVNSINAVLFTGQLNQRMHNKLFIVDDAIVINGGRNYENSYFNRSTAYNFKDREIAIMGPLVQEAKASFEEYWKFRHSILATELFDVAKFIEDGIISEDVTETLFDFNGLFPNLDRQVADPLWIQQTFVNEFIPADRVRYISDKPGKNKKISVFRLWGGGKVTRILKETIEQTQDSLIIQSPYVIVNRWARSPFRHIRKKNPQAAIIISTNSFAATDHLVSYSANYRLRSVYIEKLGFDIREFKPDPAIHALLNPQLPDTEKRLQDAGKDTRPIFGLHGKSFVMDDRTSYIGTYNLDPRSFNLNSENGFIIDDIRVARELKADILRDMAPENSWIIARKEVPLKDINNLFHGISNLSPIDLWPIRNTSTFQLKNGMDPVSPDDAAFYEHYEDVGSFPGVDLHSTDEITTSFYKVFGKFLTPAL
jgi:cardiolipin synthase C